MKLAHDALVLVIDGGKRLLLRNEGDEAFANMQVEEEEVLLNPPDRDLASDAPGRSFSSVGPGRSAMEETDFHQQEEDRFVTAAIDALNARAIAGGFEQLLIVAPPRVLGVIRKHYHKALEARLIGEIGKDLTGMEPADIEAAIAKH